ncbi:hypothetical protein [Acanthopleuribacter pedis]|uniref:Uncharacterized protein n=1 Tax=Acanthopleuribacter pedis TaxID=442870 RepID=A0A8J7QB62_9BACT|nr:hypothetical protein [Acanthopleuribacter pedis]MBO1322306.1 hypothetical protein [Acanthopleuribacter pedis]
MVSKVHWLIGLLLFPLGFSAQELEIQEDLTVGRVVFEVRVVDRLGQPVAGLQAENFQLKIGKKAVPILDCEWVDRRLPVERAVVDPDWKPELEQTDHAFIDEMGPLPGEPGYGKEKFTVVFFQGSINPERLSGMVRSRGFTQQVVDSLPTDGYTAVFSFHSHLQMKSDFTRDTDILEDALWEAVQSDPEVVFYAANYPTLTPYFSEERGREVADVETAFLELARALRNFNGAKNLIFVGWGIGSWSPSAGMRYNGTYYRAVEELIEADVSVFSLDLTLADYHSLAEGMAKLSVQTGGAYWSLFRWPNRAVKMINGTMAGHYTLTYEHPTGLRKNAKYRLRLKNARGSLVVRDPYNR